MGRRKSKHYLPHDSAVEYIHNKSTVSNRAQYQKWVREDSIAFLPIWPDRVYDDWQSWNHYLGTTNSFNKTLQHKKGVKKHYRTWWEAVRYAQQKAKDHKLKTQNDWEEWYDSGMCADDIPKRPHHVYEEFVGSGWPVWLGTKISAKQKVQQNVVAVMAIAQTVGQPNNVITIVVDGNGLSSMRDNWDQTIVGRPYRVYNWERDLIPYVERQLDHHAFKRGDNVWLVPNMNALLFELDNILEFAIPPSQLR